MRCILLYIWCFTHLLSCSAENRELQRALRAAGNNRTELKAVLDRYSCCEADSLKLCAAKYLIRYMPLQRSYAPEMEQMYDRIDSMIPMYVNRDSLTEAVSALYQQYKPELIRLPDIKTVTADFLVRNIEQAFDLWQNKPWGKHIDFEMFCECLLPYKSVDLQPLTDWRSNLADFCTGKVGKYPSEIWKDNPYIAAWEVNKTLCGLKWSYTIEPNPCPVFRATTIARLPNGTCYDTCLAAVQVMRSKGIPAYIDFTPNWPARPKSHFWLSVINNRHQAEVLSAFSLTRGDDYFIDRPLAKVFRMVYRPNDEAVAILNRDGWMPSSLGYLFVRDVTESYVKADRIDCPLYDLPEIDGTVYLAVFDNQRWVPVCWGARHNNQARFERVGRNVFYMPVVFDKARMIVPAGDPFFLEPDGKMLFMRADTLCRRTIGVSRKYGIYEEINNIQANLMGGELLAADNPQFRDARLMLKLPLDSLILAGTEAMCDHDRYRYWQARSTNEWPCDVAELRFYEGDSLLRPRLFPSIADKEYRYERISDDNALSCIALSEPNYRVGFDFGRPVGITKILCYRRCDGNDIYPGHNYSLYFWSAGGWRLLGSKRAGEQTWLEFANVPNRALLLLVCDTEGVQNRPFMWQDGTVRWF